MRADIKRKGKVEKTMKFAERIKKVQKETRKVLRKVQEEIKQQVDKERKKVEEWKKNDNVMLSTKDLVFKERLVKKLVDQYIGLYIIDKVVFTNSQIITTNFRIYLMVNVSQVV